MLEFHECARLFPLMTPAEYAALLVDMRVSGYDQSAPIVLCDGKILDGRNRHRAALEVGIEPCFITFKGDDPLAYVIRHNLHRRHLTESQRAMIAAEIANMPLGGAIYRSASLPTDAVSQASAAKMVNVSPRTVRTIKAIERDAPELLPEIKAGKLTAHAAMREVKERKREVKREQNRELVKSTSPAVAEMGVRYQTIVLDPPWDWGDEGDCDQFGRARPTYQTMPFKQVLDLPIGELAADNAHIYLWITNRSLPKGFALLEAWGFRYITALTWCKPHFGMGNYFRGSTEHVLFGVRGSLPLLVQNQGTWLEAPRASEHSSKPGAFYELIERCSPGPWLELFSRKPRPGWAAWGAEA